MVPLQSIIWVFLLNNFSRVINLLLTKLARDRPGRISALGLFCTDLGPIFSQYGPRAWLIRYISCTKNSARDNEMTGFHCILTFLRKNENREWHFTIDLCNSLPGCVNFLRQLRLFSGCQASSHASVQCFSKLKIVFSLHCFYRVSILENEWKVLFLGEQV